MKFSGGLGAAIIAVAALMPTSAEAQNQAQQQRQVQFVTQFDAPTVSRLLLDVQATWQVEQDASGATVYRAQAGEGIAFALSPRSCSAEQGCVGLLMLATFTRSDDRSATEMDAFINAYNNLNPNSKALRAGDQAVVLQSYVNAVYGITYANAQAQLLVFGQEIQKMRAELTAFSAQGR